MPHRQHCAYEQELSRQQRLRQQGCQLKYVDQPLLLVLLARPAIRKNVNWHDNGIADLRFPAAQADITAAEAQTGHADWLVAQTSPLSPVTATVEETLYQPGEWIPAGSPVVTLLAPRSGEDPFLYSGNRTGDDQGGTKCHHQL